MNLMSQNGLNLNENVAVALVEAAECMSLASNVGGFIEALDENYRLWRVMMDLASRYGWETFNCRHSEFVVSILGQCGNGVDDSDVEALVAINNEISQVMMSGRDIKQARELAMTAWASSISGESVSLESWLINQIENQANS
jgi:hypothetical protein